MISANNVTLRVGKKALFEDVNIKFTEGNCYGMIGATRCRKIYILKDPLRTDRTHKGRSKHHSGGTSFFLTAGSLQIR